MIPGIVRELASILVECTLKTTQPLRQSILCPFYRPPSVPILSFFIRFFPDFLFLVTLSVSATRFIVHSTSDNVSSASNNNEVFDFVRTENLRTRYRRVPLQWQKFLRAAVFRDFSLNWTSIRWLLYEGMR